MSNWFAYNGGESIGKTGAEGGVILCDEAHKHGGRMTLKRGKNFISVSCHIYGWLDHTRFFNVLTEAQREYVMMRGVLGSIMDESLSADASNIKMWEAIAGFVRRFP